MHEFALYAIAIAALLVLMLGFKKESFEAPQTFDEFKVQVSQKWTTYSAEYAKTLSTGDRKVFASVQKKILPVISATVDNAKTTWDKLTEADKKLLTEFMFMTYIGGMAIAVKLSSAEKKVLSALAKDAWSKSQLEK